MAHREELKALVVQRLLHVQRSAVSLLDLLAASATHPRHTNEEAAGALGLDPARREAVNGSAAEALQVFPSGARLAAENLRGFVSLEASPVEDEVSPELLEFFCLPDILFESC